MTLSFPSYEKYDRPGVWIQIFGEPAMDLVAKIVEFKLTEGSLKKKEVNKLEITLADPMFELDDDDRLRSDVVWYVRYGYARDLSPPRKYTFKFYAPDYNAQGTHTKAITLHGGGHDLIRSKSARNWGRTQSSDIAIQIARRHGLDYEVDPSRDKTETPFLQPATMDDYGYLSTLATDIDFEFYIEDDCLVYRSRDSAYGKDPYERFVYGAPGTILLSFTPEVKTTSAGNVKARAADTTAAKHKDVQPQKTDRTIGGKHLGQRLVPTTNKIDPSSMAPKKTDTVDTLVREADALVKRGNQLKIDVETGKAFQVEAPKTPDAAAKTVTTPETNKAKVERIAEASKRGFLDESVKAKAAFIGTPRISRGRTFIFVLPERRLSGKWYVREATHTINDRGYTVSADLHKGALNEGGGKKNKDVKGNRTNVDKNGVPVTDQNPRPVVVIDAETGATVRKTFSKGHTAAGFANSINRLEQKR